MIGAGEVFLLPLDILKIKMQTNPNLLKDQSVFDIVKKERMNLYKGTGMTIMRNVPGSFVYLEVILYPKNIYLIWLIIQKLHFFKILFHLH